MEEICINKRGRSGSKGSVGSSVLSSRECESVSYCAGANDMQVQHKWHFTSVQLWSPRGLGLCYKIKFVNKRESSVLSGIVPRRQSSLGVEVLGVSLQSEGAGLLDGSQHLLVQHWEGGVRWQVQAVKAGVSSAGTTGRSAGWMLLFCWSIDIHLTLLRF